ncbi:MAG: Gfo/Idh/MocA family oxidoreductase [Pseudomonadota bacterium]
MGDERRVGVIGLGIMGRRMIEHMARHERFAPARLFDPSEASREAAAALGAGAVVGSAEEAMEEVDLVYLACPPAPRRAYALMAAEAGRAIFLEKPLGVDVEESRDLVRRLAGARVAVNFTQAAGDALRTIRDDFESGGAGAPAGADIVVTYPAWPRAWQADADWLRFREEGGFTREVVSHFLFFTARVLGPLRLVWSRPGFPADPALCETHMAAELRTEQGAPVSVFASVGGAQPDRQEMTIKGAARSWRVSEFFQLSRSDGGPFAPVGAAPADPRAPALRAQLDELDKMIAGEPHLLASPEEGLAAQELVEAMLAGRG